MKEISLSKPDITGLERDAVLAVLKTNQLSLGPKIEEFETKMARFIGTKHAIAVNSGTSALHLSVIALGLKEGDEVITTPFSFIASANCLLYEKCTPVFVDIDPCTLNLDTRQIEAKITNRTKAILPVHVFGLPCNMDEICQLSEKHNLRIIEDSCEAIGATFNGKKVGGIGDCGVFGFYPNKQMTTGEGGMIVTNNDEVADLARSLRNQGRDSHSSWLAHQRLGYNYRISDIQSALGIAQLERIEELLEKREKVAKFYNDLFKNIPNINLLQNTPKAKKSWFVYVLHLGESFSKEQRDQILANLKKRKIACSNYFPPIHLQPFYIERFGYKPGDFPVTESICERTIALPFHGGLSKEEIVYIADNFKQVLEPSATHSL